MKAEYEIAPLEFAIKELLKNNPQEIQAETPNLELANQILGRAKEILMEMEKQKQKKTDDPQEQQSQNLELKNETIDIKKLIKENFI